MTSSPPFRTALLHPVLLVEDDLDLGAELQRAFQSHGVRCVWVRRMLDAARHVQSDINEEYCCVVLDLGLPDGDGLELLRRWRELSQSISVIVLSARDAVSSRIECLDSGADDYVVKPVMPQELVSRIRAVVRRRAGQDQSTWSLGALRIDPGRQQVWLGDQSIGVSPKEFALLCELARHAGHVVTKHKLVRVIDPLGDLPDFNALEVHVHNLRRKIGTDTIRTVRGVGYRLDQ